MKANEIVKLFTKIDSRSFQKLPVAHLVLEDSKKEIGQWEICGIKNKTGVRLSREELERQLNLVDWYIKRANLPVALLVMWGMVD